MATSMIRKAIAQRSSGVSLNSRETAKLLSMIFCKFAMPMKLE
jgi:hypothetical protein